MRPTLNDHLAQARAAIAAANDPVRMALFVGAVSEVVVGGAPRYLSPLEFTKLVEAMCGHRWDKRWVLQIVYAVEPELCLPEWRGWSDR